MSASTRRRRLNLLKRDPHCHWCGVEVVEWTPFVNPPANAATLDHLYSRLNPNRTIPSGTRTDPREIGTRTVIACLKCNNARGAAEHAALPPEEQWRRSGRAPKGER